MRPFPLEEQLVPGVLQRLRSITLEWLTVLVAITAAVASTAYLYSKFIKPTPAIVSLAAFFVDQNGNFSSPGSPDYDNSHLRIAGNAYKQEPLSGEVRLTVSNADASFKQSVSVKLNTDGSFATDDPAFRSIRPGAQIQITADVLSPKLPEGKTTEEIHLNSAPPANKLWLEVGGIVLVLLLALIFAYAFTGKKTARKNRTAIIFSYAIIGIAIAVPMYGPAFLVQVFPRSVDAMIGAPVGLVNTHTANLPADQTEWALNIGGYSFKAPVRFEGSKNISAGNTGSSNNTDPTGAQPVSISISPDSNTATQQSTAGVPSPTQTTSGNASNVGTAEKSVSSDSSLQPIKVQGGLVIPLCVIILAVIGGAINMTRKVPGFQRESEDSDFARGSAITNPLSTALGAIKTWRKTRNEKEPQPVNTLDVNSPNESGGTVPRAQEDTQNKSNKTELSSEAQATTVDQEITQRLTDQISCNSDTETNIAKIRSLLAEMENLFKSKKTDGPLFLKFTSYDDWLASQPRLRDILGGSWRAELLNQYMYLISAPFLAIVSYYIIDLLGLNKQGVVVVIAFSVGLVSEKIVSWILGIATGYMTNPKSSPVPSK